MNFLEQQLSAAGFFQSGIVDTKDIVFSSEVRKLCADNVCRQYGASWSCPPAVGTVEECRARIQKYDKMLVFTGKYALEDSFDYEGMTDGRKRFAASCRVFDEAIRPYLKDFLLFANEGCDLCKKCTYPDAPCRFPEKMHPSLEANGIFVNELAALAGVNYINGANTVTYFGALVCDASDLERLQTTPAK